MSFHVWKKWATDFILLLTSTVALHVFGQHCNLQKLHWVICWFLLGPNRASCSRDNDFCDESAFFANFDLDLCDLGWGQRSSNLCLRMSPGCLHHSMKQSSEYIPICLKYWPKLKIQPFMTLDLKLTLNDPKINRFHLQTIIYYGNKY